MAGRLVLVATPIGNLGDLSPRAAEALCEVDLVLAEDTRRTGRLLKHVGSTVPQLSLHDHNESERIATILDRLESGQTLALVSDAGTPAVSDPGYRVVAACAAAGHEITAVPGASAVLHALVTSGLPTDRFVFDGFLARKATPRARQLDEIGAQPRTTVVFLSPHRAEADLRDLAAACGGHRRAALGRELTKLHEEVIRGDLASIAATVGEHGVRGELTLVIEGRTDDHGQGLDVTPGGLASAVADLEASGLERKEAIKQVARERSLPKSEVYDAVIAFKN